MIKLAPFLLSLSRFSCLSAPTDPPGKNSSSPPYPGKWEERRDFPEGYVVITFHFQSAERLVLSYKGERPAEGGGREVLDTSDTLATRFDPNLPVFSATSLRGVYNYFWKAMAGELLIFQVMPDPVDTLWRKSGGGEARPLGGAWESDLICGSHFCATVRYDFTKSDSLLISSTRSTSVGTTVDTSSFRLVEEPGSYFELFEGEKLAAGYCYFIREPMLNLLRAKIDCDENRENCYNGGRFSLSKVE